jgi:hypothetical protein
MLEHGGGSIINIASTGEIHRGAVGALTRHPSMPSWV